MRVDMSSLSPEGNESRDTPLVTPSNVSIPHGVYVLRNVQSRTALDVANGGWHDAKMQGWQTGKVNTDPTDLVNRRFVICSNTSTPEAINIFGLVSGAYVSYLPVASGFSFSRSVKKGHALGKGSALDIDETVVRARATCAQNKECLWIAEEVSSSVEDNRIFRFRPYNDRRRLLDLTGGSADNGATVRAWIPDTTEGAPSQHWILERTDMDTDPTADWMSQVSPQSTKFSMMSIPGTHQSLALRPLPITDNPRCQNRAPFLQLADGIRLLDLRLDQYAYGDEAIRAVASSLVARHGKRQVFSTWEGYALSAVLQSIACFLHDHPGETIFVNAHIETSPDTDPREWVRLFYREVKPYGSCFFYVEDTRTFADVSLNDIRGKAVLLCDSIKGANKPIDVLGHYQAPVNNVKLFFRTYSHIEVFSAVAPAAPILRSDWKAHGEWLSAHIAAAGKDENEHHVYRTGLNSSGLPGIPGRPLGVFYNPIDFFRWLQQNWIPQETDSKRHPQGLRMGVITLDFYEQADEFVKFIIGRNNGVTL